jgi:hypothetical protein
MRESALRERTEGGPSGPRDQNRPVPPSVDEADVLNWDAAIEVPAPRRSGTIRASLDRAGRSRPIPVEDPASA